MLGGSLREHPASRDTQLLDARVRRIALASQTLAQAADVAAGARASAAELVQRALGIAHTCARTPALQGVQIVVMGSDEVTIS